MLLRQKFVHVIESCPRSDLNFLLLCFSRAFETIMASPSGARQPASDKISRHVYETPLETQQVDRRSPHCVAPPPEQRGGYDCDFVETPQELQADCPICLVVLREPFQVTCCGNSFCRTCIERIETDKKACPTCNEVSFSTFPNKGLQRALYSFYVQCVHQKSGCKWIGELGKLDQHLNLSPELGRQLISCEFAEIPCAHCREYFQRRHVHAHETESCPQRPFSCDYCKDYGTVYEDVVNNHWPVCKCYLVPCPNECGVSPERQNVKTHVNTVCPLTVVHCDFRYAGCEVQLVRKDMPTHLAESLLPHLSLLALHNQQLTQLTIQQKKNLEECQQKIQELEQKTLTSQCEIGGLKQKVNEDVEQEVAELRRQQDEDRTSLVTVQQQIGMLPPLKLTMTNYEEMKNTNGEWYSPPFYTHPQGYKMCLNVVANGCGDSEGTHVSVYAYLMRGEFDDRLKWPFQGSVVLQLCNQLEDRKHHGYIVDFSKTTNPETISRVTSGERAEGWGTHTLIAHSVLKLKRFNKCQYLKKDCLHFRVITVESLLEPGVLPTELTMINFEQQKIDIDHWFSPSFYTYPRGYKMCLSVVANGCGDGEGTHVSVFAYLTRGEFDDHLKWPFQGHIIVAILNQLEDNNHATKTIPFTEPTDLEYKHIGRVTDGERAPSGWGYHTFIAHTDLNYKPAKNCQYLKHDCLRFRVVQVELK